MVDGSQIQALLELVLCNKLETSKSILIVRHEFRTVITDTYRKLTQNKLFEKTDRFDFFFQF